MTAICSALSTTIDWKRAFQRTQKSPSPARIKRHRAYKAFIILRRFRKYLVTVTPVVSYMMESIIASFVYFFCDVLLAYIPILWKRPSHNQYINDVWTSFIRTHSPQLDMNYHAARGRSYESSLSLSQGTPFDIFSPNSTTGVYDFNLPPTRSGLVSPQQCQVRVHLRPAE